MALASPTMDVEKEFECPICMEYLSDPVSVDCGHNFCRGCITSYCEKWEDLGDLECPLCKAKIKRESFRRNWLLKNIAEQIKSLSFETETEATCERHQEKLNLFCKEDAALVCVHCERAPEHQSHTVLLLEKAAEEYKSQFSTYLDTLEKEKMRILAYQAATEKESQDLLVQTKAVKDKTVAEFRQLRQFMEDEENRLLAHLEEMEKEAAGRRKELLASLSGEFSSVESLIREMKEKCQQPPNKLLKDVRSTLQRCEKKKTFENPVASFLALKWRNWEISDVHSSLEGVIKQCKDALVSQLRWQKANMTLHPDTAHTKPILSEDCKSVRVGDTYQVPPDNPERFDRKAAVLGREGFTAGKHFWDADSASDW